MAQSWWPELDVLSADEASNSSNSPLSGSEVSEVDSSEEEDDFLVQLLIDNSIDQTMAPVDLAIHGGSRPGRQGNIERKRAEGHKNLWDDYFVDEPIFEPAEFYRRYRMRRALFVRIMDTIAAYDPYFIQTRDAAGLLGLSTI
jgi:hypothetical protein